MGPTKVQKCRSIVLHFFVNILRFENDQRFKFGDVAVLSLVNNSNSLDHQLGSQKSVKKRKKKKEKTGQPTMTVFGTMLVYVCALKCFSFASISHVIQNRPFNCF